MAPQIDNLSDQNDRLHTDDDADDSITLVLDDKYELTVSRCRLAKSCPYLQCLMNGPYREAGQSRINIQSEGMFSYDAFEVVIKFANDNLFIRDKEKLDLHFDVLDLAILWSYDGLIDVIQAHLIDCLSIETGVDIHTVADYHNLKQLQEGCLEFERSLEKAIGSIRRKSGYCPLEGHDKHHYTSCSERRARKTVEDEDWDGLN